MEETGDGRKRKNYFIKEGKSKLSPEKLFETSATK